MKKVNIPNALFIRNRKSLVDQLSPNSVAIIKSNDKLDRNGDQHFPFRQNSGLFYLTGLEQEKCVLALCPDHPDATMREVLFTIKPIEKMETWTGHKYTPEDIKEISGIKTVKWLDNMDIMVRDMVINSKTIYLNLNEYIKHIPDISYNDYNLAKELKEKFPLHNFKRLAPLLSNQRMVKQPEELELLKEACKITESAFKRVLKFVKPGVKEYEVEAEMTHEFISKGARGHAYQPIIGSGKNALVLHYIENSAVCQDGDLLLMDFGAEYGNYAADCSRTIPVNGKFSTRQKECYEAVLKVQKKATKLFVPGNTIDKVNKAVWKMMETEMINLGLFTKEDVKNQKPESPFYFKYLMHGVAHFIGLDVHDVGGKYEPFKEGMVLTIEPGLYIKEEGIGIRIENNIVVGKTPIDLMANIPREVGEIEGLMK